MGFEKDLKFTPLASS